jgi:hypothetical protein
MLRRNRFKFLTALVDANLAGLPIDNGKNQLFSAHLSELDALSDISRSCEL